MPSARDILANLSEIANEAVAVAIAWHAVSALAAFALLAGWRPSNRTGAILLSVPLASVSVAGWVVSNPFNGTAFAVATLGLAALAVRGDADLVQAGNRVFLGLGLALFVYAWVYPHFLVDRSPLAYLYAAPLGIIPCPTLALVVALTLAGDGLVGGPWRIAVACLAAFYAIFGIARLDVRLDAGLLAGAVALLAQHWSTVHGRAPRATS